MYYDDNDEITEPYETEYGTLPVECILQCSSQGSVDDAVEYWVKELNFNPAADRDECVRYLSEFGAWTKEELNDEEEFDNERINQTILWIACCDIREGQDWFGLEM